MNTFGPAQIFGKFDASMILYLFYKILCTYFRDSTISNLFKTRGNISSNCRILHTKMPVRFHKRICSIDHSAFRADQMLEQMGIFSLSRPVVPGVPWPPQILADQLTLSKPWGGGRLCLHISTPPPTHFFFRPKAIPEYH